MVAFWVNIAAVCALNLLCHYGLGLLVRYRNVRVNYTRKAGFFAAMFLQLAAMKVLPYDRTAFTVLIRIILLVSILAIYIRPIRKRVRFIYICFLSFDRPEDRPNTLLWLSTQYLAAYLVLIPLSLVFIKHGYGQLVMIPILVVIFGDGLAEPVGIRFGKHKYKTGALFSKKTYERSLEGSACVWLSGVIAILCYRAHFDPRQFYAALVIVPLLMALVEAVSPHTWDAPLIYLAGFCPLLFIIAFVG